jgi:hemerythrin-like metal-binding protein
LAFMTWNDSYSVKVRAIDEEHKQLFKMVNNLYDAMKSGQGSVVVGKVLEQLIRYTRTHFANEEDAMAEVDYPEFLSHVAVHRELTQKVEELSVKVKGGALGVSVEVMDFLQRWLTDHIMHMDQKYVPYLAAQGVRTEPAVVTD